MTPMMATWGASELRDVDCYSAWKKVRAWHGTLHFR
jgi:hypothetical protein